MRAQLHNTAGDQHSNLIRVTNRRDTVRNEKRRATLHHALQFSQNLLLRVGVYAGKSIIEDQYPRIADNRAGNGSALLLAAGEGNTALPNHRPQTRRKFFKFAPDVGRLSRLEHLSLAGPGSPKGNVSPNGLAE